MSSTGRPVDEDEELSAHGYFRAIEDAFIRLRGAPFLLSPEDWRVAREWRRLGVPVELVERVLERIMRRRETPEQSKARRIYGLRYFDSAVNAAWRSMRAMVGSEAEREAEPLDVGSRLAALAAAVAGHASLGAALGDRIRALGGTTEEVEKGLARLDETMLAAARRGLDGEQRRAVAERVAAGLEPVAARLSPDALDAARERLERQVLRRFLGLPLLSLFSSDARTAAESEHE